MLSSSINLQWPPFIQRAASDILTDYGPFVFVNRPVRTRTPGGVGAGGEKPPATRLGAIVSSLTTGYPHQPFSEIPKSFPQQIVYEFRLLVFWPRFRPE